MLSTVPIFPIFSYIFCKAPITSYILEHFLYFPVFFVIVRAVIVRVSDLVTLVIDMFVLVNCCRLKVAILCRLHSVAGACN